MISHVSRYAIRPFISHLVLKIIKIIYFRLLFNKSASILLLCRVCHKIVLTLLCHWHTIIGTRAVHVIFFCAQQSPTTRRVTSSARAMAAGAPATPSVCRAPTTDSTSAAWRAVTRRSASMRSPTLTTSCARAVTTSVPAAAADRYVQRIRALWQLLTTDFVSNYCASKLH